MNCIFADDDQWTSAQELAPGRIARISSLERGFGTTIKKGRTVEETAMRGREFVSDKPEELMKLAMSHDAFTTGMFFLAEGESWTPPLGAFKRCGGPS